MSGAFSTAKLACSTCPLCSLLMPPSSPSTALPTFRLSLIDAVWERSSRVRARWPSLTPRFTPPIRSAAFSFWASQRAAVLDAPLSDSTKTELPRAVGLMKASAWMETKRSA